MRPVFWSVSAVCFIVDKKLKIFQYTAIIGILVLKFAHNGIIFSQAKQQVFCAGLLQRIYRQSRK